METQTRTMEANPIHLPTGHQEMKKGLQNCNPVRKLNYEPYALSLCKGKYKFANNQPTSKNCFTFQVSINANSSNDASLMAIALQNVLNELGDNQDYLLELANPQTVKQYKALLTSILDKPLVKSVFGV